MNQGPPYETQKPHWLLHILRCIAYGASAVFVAVFLYWLGVHL